MKKHKKSRYQTSLEYIEPKVDNIENNTKKIAKKTENNQSTV